MKSKSLMLQPSNLSFKSATLVRFAARAAIAVTAFAASVAISTPAQAQVPLFFDGFLADNAGQPTNNYNGFFLWNVTDGTVDLVGGNVIGVDPPPLGRFVDLDGSTNDAGAFATKTALVFTPGTTYNLSFLYNSTDGTANTATATIGSQVFSVSSTNTAFQTFSQNFTVNTLTSANLVFQDLGNDSAGIGIDDVSVTVVAAAAPEPGSLFLLGMGLVGGWGMVDIVRPRKQAKAVKHST